MSSHTHACRMADVILGGQDGLVNVLGLTMGVAAAGSPPNLVVVAGLAAMMAESISMAAVAYTSSHAARDYERLRAREAGMDEKEVEAALRTLKTSRLAPQKLAFIRSRLRSHLEDAPGMDSRSKALMVGVSTLGGSLVPLLPYLVLGVEQAIGVSILLSALVLFGTGALKAKWTNGPLLRSGLEILLVGGLAAAAGYLLGVALHVPAA
ncbi:VIT family protein [uncultured archaeon]|nr:VIT family protein [uncultured archaeon]